MENTAPIYFLTGLLLLGLGGSCARLDSESEPLSRRKALAKVAVLSSQDADRQEGDSAGVSPVEPELEDDSRSEEPFKPVQLPAPILGTNLTLNCEQTILERSATDGILSRYEFVCKIHDSEGNIFTDTSLLKEFGWGVDDQTLDYRIARSEENPLQVRYVFGEKRFVDFEELSQARLQFTYKSFESSDQTVLNSRIGDVLTGLSSQSQFRIVIKSIMENDKPLQGTDGLIWTMELKIDGEWHRIIGEGLSYTLMGRPVLSNLTYFDLPWINTLRGVESALITEMPRFSPIAPFDVNVNAGHVPIYLSFGFDNPVSISGVRFNEGRPRSQQNLVTGTPDWFHFETSSDGVTYQVVNGSDIMVGRPEDTQVLEYYWNGSDF